jgi:subtilisin family serine protease
MVMAALACVPAFAQVGPGQDVPGAAARRGPKYVPDHLLVRFQPGLAAEGRASAHAQLGAQVLRAYRSVPGLELVRIPPGLGVREAIRVYRNNPNVLYAEPDYTVRALETTPNDTSFSDLWAMKNTGVPFGTVDADIDATDAWDLSTGSSSIVVGVIDSGVKYTHADLVDNIYNNTAECSGTASVDDDGNGYVDDCHGIDTANDDGDPNDDEDHGTHVSGTIGASPPSPATRRSTWTRKTRSTS